MPAGILAPVTAWHSSLRRIERLCATATEARSLRFEALGEIAREVRFDAWVWLLTDPVTTVGSAPLADVPCLPELPTAIRLKYLTETNRWTALAGATTRVGLLRNDTGDDPAQSRQWREFLHRYGVQDVASTVFTDRFGVWGFLDLWRSDPAPFDADEAEYLNAVAGPLTSALRGCQANTFAGPATGDPRDLGPVVVLVDDDLEVLGRTAASTDWLETLLPPEPGREAVPASIYNVAGQLLAVEEGVDTHPARARVHLAEGLWVTLRAARLNAVGAGKGPIAVTIEAATAEERLEVFARAYGLSRRETELLEHLPVALDTRDLAGRLFISDYTVQDHLKSIFAKTGAVNRQALLARAVGR